MASADGRVSIWVGFDRQPPDMDLLRDLCRVPRYDPDSQEIIVDNKGWQRRPVSILLYGFNAEPLAAVHAEVRGGGDPHPVLTALCRGNGWVAIDDATGGTVVACNPRALPSD